MKRSSLFVRTQKEAPADEVSKNAQLLIRAGYVYKVMAGVYAYTPLGIRVVENIKQIIREEMNALDAGELIMTSLQRQDTWAPTGRWSDDVVDIWFKTELKDGTEVGLAWSHEEAIIEMMKQHITSYRDLPTAVYQFQTKFRNELRSKSGIMRGREFVMKDMYSCSYGKEDHDTFYAACIEAYTRVFARLGIGKDTYVTFASGGAFTQYSHEFQTLCDAGEDVVYLHKGKNIAINEEVMNDEMLAELGLKREELELVKTAEVGNIFDFGTQKSEETDFSFIDKDGKKRFVYLGSYGIGVTRVMGVLAEKMSDDKGLIWPLDVAPFKVYLASIGDEVRSEAGQLYQDLQEAGITVLYDDRDVRPGEKFADADLMGIPYRIVVSQKTLKEHSVELKQRDQDGTTMVTLGQIIATLQ